MTCKPFLGFTDGSLGLIHKEECRPGIKNRNSPVKNRLAEQKSANADSFYKIFAI